MPWYCSIGSWADRSPLHEAASQGRLLSLKTLIAQVKCENVTKINVHFYQMKKHFYCFAKHEDGITSLFINYKFWVLWFLYLFIQVKESHHSIYDSDDDIQIRIRYSPSKHQL